MAGGRVSELEQHIRMYVRQTTPALWLSTVLNYVVNMENMLAMRSEPRRIEEGPGGWKAVLGPRVAEGPGGSKRGCESVYRQACLSNRQIQLEDR